MNYREGLPAPVVFGVVCRVLCFDPRSERST